MFSSLFSASAPVDPTAPTFHPVSSRYGPGEVYGALEAKDTEWLCSGGFVAETQVWYSNTEDGGNIMCQIIHSSIGVWYPTIQFTCKIYDPKTKETIWRSINVSNFAPGGPAGPDKRSSKADEFTVKHRTHPSDPAYPESYTITANLSADLQISVDVKRPASAPGFKIGNSPNGGYSYFGHDVDKPEGYVVHRFWPYTAASGHIIHKGAARSFAGPGMFVHAIQGMRPNLVAARWNFADFQSSSHGGCSAIQMEFTTIDAYGRKGAGSGGVAVNVGSVVLGGKLVAVTAETKWPDEEQSVPDSAPLVSRAHHHDTAHDPDTSYDAPRALSFEWAAPSLLADAPGRIDAKVYVDVGGPAKSDAKGLIEKVDFLAEIPAMVKAVISYVAGTKPYIYQWMNPAKLVVKGPAGLLPGLENGLEIEGHLYNEATFIS